jgi:hypothetical protein
MIEAVFKNGGGRIQKQELIRVHADLVRMKNSFEKMGYKNEFREYQELLISPTHVHKSKDDHEKAIFILSSKLSSLVAEQKEMYKFSKLKEELKTGAENKTN